MVLMQAKESYFLMQSRPGFYRGVFYSGQLLTTYDQIIMTLLNRGYLIVNPLYGFALIIDLRLQKVGGQCSNQQIAQTFA